MASAHPDARPDPRGDITWGPEYEYEYEYEYEIGRSRTLTFYSFFAPPSAFGFSSGGFLGAGGAGDPRSSRTFAASLSSSIVS